jgi:hypothetical protein
MTFPDYSRAYRVEQYRHQHTPRPARLPACLQAEFPAQPIGCERITVEARERGAPVFVGEGDPSTKPFDINDYAHPLGEAFPVSLLVPIEATSLCRETAELLEQGGVLNHAFSRWAQLTATN